MRQCQRPGPLTRWSAGRWRIELSPAYVDLAVDRWQTFTGGIATHEESGAAFNVRKAALAASVEGQATAV